MANDATNMRWAAWFLWGSALYFLIQAVQRTVLGGTLEVDEAEMLVLAEGWQWGYGPQLPLYNWAQVLVFAILGKTTAALAFLKAGVLWLAGAGMFFAMRLAFGNRQAAMAAALSLAFLPNVLWEFQRASTHSIALLAAVTWTLWAWFAVMQRGRVRDWLILGGIIGLGGLSKANYWAVPLGLAVASIGLWPRAPGWRGPIAAVAVAAGIVAVPYGWAVFNPDQSLASVGKFYRADPAGWSWLFGLGQLGSGVVVALALPGLIFGCIWAFGARGRMAPMTDGGRILLRVAVLSLGVAALLVAVFGVTTIQARWLVPIYICLTAAAFARLGAALTPRAFRVLPGVAVLCALVTIAGMAQIRMEPGRTATLDLTDLSALADQLTPTRIEGDYLIAGNLELLDPSRETAVTGTALRSGDVVARLLNLGPEPALPDGMQVQDRGTVTLRYRGAADKGRPLDWQLLTRTTGD